MKAYPNDPTDGTHEFMNTDLSHPKGLEIFPSLRGTWRWKAKVQSFQTDHIDFSLELKIVGLFFAISEQKPQSHANVSSFAVKSEVMLRSKPKARKVLRYFCLNRGCISPLEIVAIIYFPTYMQLGNLTCRYRRTVPYGAACGPIGEGLGPARVGGGGFRMDVVTPGMAWKINKLKEWK